MASVHNQIVPQVRAYWLLQGIPPILRFLSGIPEDDHFFKDIEPEAPTKVNSIRKDRERILAAQKLKVSVASRIEDILPASSLQAGITRSIAVCRIARYFSRNSFKAFIEGIETIIKDQENNSNFDSVEKLKEIFLIPDSVAEDFFKKVNNLQNSVKFLEANKTPNSLQFLDALKNISEIQLSKLNPIPVGTGFLVGGSHLLTNCHVLPDKKIAEQCVAQFNYVEDDQGYIKTSVDYEFDSELLFIPEQNLDYTIVQLKTSSFKQQPGYKFGWIQLIEDDGNILPGDGIFVIHHPKGNPKKIDLTNNEIIEQGLWKNFLRYRVDTDYGSSGSPIFNNKWQLVALHHAVVPDKNGAVQQGIRICRIVEDLKKKSFSNSKLQSFIEDFVITSEQLNYPPLPSGLEFDGVGSYVSLDSSIAFATVRTEEKIDREEGRIEEANSTVKFWSQGGVELRRFEIPEGIYDMSVSPDGQILACCLDNAVKLWSIDGKELNTLKGNGGSLQSVSFSADGTTIVAYTTNSDNSDADLLVWNLDSGSLKTLSSTKLEISRTYGWGCDNLFSFSPDGKTIATIGKDSKTVKLWSLEGSLLKTFKGHTDTINDIKFSPDGKTLASGSSDKTIKLWNVVTSEEIITLKKHREAVQSISFSPDGKSIASASDDNTVRLWNFDSSVLKTFNGRTNKINAIFSPDFDSQTLAIMSANSFTRNLSTTIALWNVAENKKIKESSEVLTPGSFDFRFNGQAFAFGGLDVNDVNGITKIQFLKPTEDKNEERFITLDAGKLVTFFPSKTHYLEADTQDTQDISQPFSIEAWVNPYPDGKGGTIIQELPTWFYDAELGKGEQLHIYIDEKGRVGVDGLDLRNIAEAEIDQNEAQEKRDREKEIAEKKKALTVQFGEFSHIVVTYDGQYSILYINGHEKLKKLKSEKNLKCCLLFKNLQANSIPFLIGSSPSLDAYVDGEQVKYNYIKKNLFKGIISEVRLWNIARTQHEIQADMYRSLSGNEEGLVGYWRFEEGEGDRVYNLASKSDYGIVCGARRLRASQFPSPPLPCGLKCSEEGAHINCGNHESLNITGNDTENITEKNTEAITVEAWVKHKFGNGLIVSRGRQKEKGYCLSWYEGKIRVTLQGENPAEKTIIDTKDNAPSDCMWHHVAFTWDKNSTEIAIYIDGRLQNSVVIEGKSKSIVFQGQYKSIGLFEGSISKLTANLLIGVREENKNYFNVVIADVRLWKVARTQDEIKANMSRRLKGDENGLIGYWRLDDGGEGNTQVRNLVSDNNHGTVYGAKWFPAPPSTPQDSPK